MPALLPFPVTFPFQLSSTDPDGDIETARKLSDRIIYASYYMSLLLGVPMDVDITEPLALNASLLGTRNLDVRVTDGSHATFDADYVLTGAPNNHLLLKASPPTRTLDIGLAGPIANGRDQAGVFPGNSFIHTYWISTGTGNPRVLASLAPPVPAPGPTVPPGYFLGAYCGALRLDAGGALLMQTIRGRWTNYKAERIVLGAGFAAGDTVVDCSGSVPPNALSLRVLCKLASTIGSTVAIRTTIKDGLLQIAGTLAKQDHGVVILYAPLVDAVLTVANYNQQVFYAHNTLTNTPVLIMGVIGFENPTAAG